MINFRKISDMFGKFLDCSLRQDDASDNLGSLIKSCIETNYKIWRLEDVVRIKNTTIEKIAQTKLEIDKNNQIRNDIIQKMDGEIEIVLKNDPSGPKEKFYAESPGMIIDRLSIFFIRLSEIKKISTLLDDDKDLKTEYQEKEKIVAEQINQIGEFLDSYLSKIQKKEVFFKIHKPVKIYNDERVKKYIQKLAQEEQKVD